MVKEAGKDKVKEFKIPPKSLKNIVPAFQTALAAIPSILQVKKVGSILLWEENLVGWDTCCHWVVMDNCDYLLNRVFKPASVLQSSQTSEFRVCTLIILANGGVR